MLAAGTSIESLLAGYPWLEREDCHKVTQDAKLDSHVLVNQGIRLAGCVHDTVLESYVLEVHERRDLASLAQRHCGWTTLGYDEVTGKGVARIPFSSVDIERATAYAAQDADCILALHEILYGKIESDAKLKLGSWRELTASEVERLRRAAASTHPKKAAKPAP